MVGGGGVLAAVLGAQFGGPVGAALAGVVFLIGSGAAALGLALSYPHGRLGLCNGITVARLALTASLAGLLAGDGTLPEAMMWLAFGIAVFSLALDGVDGWAARRSGLTSDFGARFDMEVDAAFALLLSVLAYHTGQAGLWVLILGVPRYLWVMAGWLWPWLAGPLDDRFSRKVVCVFQIGTLTAFLAPIVPAAVLTVAAVCASAALLWSFQRDIRHLAKTRLSRS
ncbi:MAG: CDP-alcohol phosphatidyltransferase family protein [Pseudomonadota bacterium]